MSLECIAWLGAPASEGCRRPEQSRRAPSARPAGLGTLIHCTQAALVVIALSHNPNEMRHKTMP